jgi:hypothetical protein
MSLILKDLLVKSLRTKGLERDPLPSASLRADPVGSVYSACLVIFSRTPTHIRVTNSDDPP